MIEKNKNVLPALLSLFASASTLLCCALPALLVTLGFGAVVAGLVSNFPGLIWLSEHKTSVFATAGLIVILSGILQLKSSRGPCPIDPGKRQACLKMRKINGWVFGISLILYGTGFFFAFLAKYFIR